MSPKKPQLDGVNAGTNATEAAPLASSVPKPKGPKRSIKQKAEDAEKKNANQIDQIKKAGKKANENEQSSNFGLAMAIVDSANAAGLNAGAHVVKNVEEKYDNLKQGVKNFGQLVKDTLSRLKPAPSTPNPGQNMEDAAQKGATGAQAVVTNLQDVKRGHVTAGQDKQDDVEMQDIKPPSP